MKRTYNEEKPEKNKILNIYKEYILKNNATEWFNSFDPTLLNSEEYNELVLFSVKEKNKQFVKYLINDKPESVNCVVDGYTPLMQAVLNEDINMVKYLNLKGANANIEKELFKTTGVNPLLNKYTPTIYASMLGNLEIVKYLVSKGANSSESMISERDVEEEGANCLYNTTPVIQAVIYGHEHIVKWFYERDGNYLFKNTLDIKGKDCLTYAIELENLSMIQLILEKMEVFHKGWESLQYNKEYLSLAIKKGNCEIIEHLLDKGVSTNEFDKNGQTPLMIAIQSQNIKIIKLLLAQGVNVNEEDNMGRSIQDYALATKNPNIIEIFQDNGKDVIYLINGENTAVANIHSDVTTPTKGIADLKYLSNAFKVITIGNNLFKFNLKTLKAILASALNDKKEYVNILIEAHGSEVKDGSKAYELAGYDAKKLIQNIVEATEGKKLKIITTSCYGANIFESLKGITVPEGSIFISLTGTSKSVFFNDCLIRYKNFPSFTEFFGENVKFEDWVKLYCLTQKYGQSTPIIGVMGKGGELHKLKLNKYVENGYKNNSDSDFIQELYAIGYLKKEQVAGLMQKVHSGKEINSFKGPKLTQELFLKALQEGKLNDLKKGLGETFYNDPEIFFKDSKFSLVDNLIELTNKLDKLVQLKIDFIDKWGEELYKKLPKKLEAIEANYKSTIKNLSYFNFAEKKEALQLKKDQEALLREISDQEKYDYRLEINYKIFNSAIEHCTPLQLLNSSLDDIEKYIINEIPNYTKLLLFGAFGAIDEANKIIEGFNEETEISGATSLFNEIL